MASDLMRTNMAALGPKPRPVIERWADKVDVPFQGGCPDPEPCWRWIASKTGSGYGHIGVGTVTDGTARNVMAHRVSYEHFIGPIPEGLDLDHICHNDSGCPGGNTCPHRACVNPWHLEPVTRSENLRRGQGGDCHNAAKTHCAQGHAYDEANTRRRPTGGRVCRACARERARAKRSRGILNA